MSHFELHAHMKIRPGILEGFKAQAAEMIRITREQDTRTLRYDWFLKEDGTGATGLSGADHATLLKFIE